MVENLTGVEIVNWIKARDHTARALAGIITGKIPFEKDPLEGLVPEIKTRVENLAQELAVADYNWNQDLANPDRYNYDEVEKHKVRNWNEYLTRARERIDHPDWFMKDGSYSIKYYAERGK